VSACLAHKNQRNPTDVRQSVNGARRLSLSNCGGNRRPQIRNLFSAVCFYGGAQNDEKPPDCSGSGGFVAPVTDLVLRGEELIRSGPWHNSPLVLNYTGQRGRITPDFIPRWSSADFQGRLEEPTETLISYLRLNMSAAAGT
jgi:hypothetical protein